MGNIKIELLEHVKIIEKEKNLKAYFISIQNNKIEFQYLVVLCVPVDTRFWSITFDTQLYMQSYWAKC